MNLIQFQQLFENEPRYRLEQAKKALLQDLIQNWQEAIGLPLNLRKRLDKEFPIKISAETFISKDKNTTKALVYLEDGLKIEAVLMRHSTFAKASTSALQASADESVDKPTFAKASADKQDKRNTVCVSSQVGCPMNCSFCATGKMGFKRNLEVWEIIEQILFFARYLKKIKVPTSSKSRILDQSVGKKITNVVFMGMGEPFLNYQNVIDAIKILNDENGFNLGARHISISTVGVIAGIEKLAKEGLQINLAISLHAPDNKTRSKLMPANKNWPIEKILNAVDEYIKKTNRRVMFEYIMLKGINDSEKHAKALVKLMKKPLYFVNLISYNFTHRSLGEGGPASPSLSGPAGIFEPSSPARIKRFKEILEHGGVTVTQRYSFGQDIKGACGQLAAKK